MANNSITGITVCTCKTCGSQWEALCAADVVDTCHECQKEAGLTVDRKPQMQMRKCAQCGKDFSPLQPEFEFCPTCFKAGARLCRTCGGAFIPAKSHFRDCPKCYGNTTAETEKKKAAKAAAEEKRRYAAVRKLVEDLFDRFSSCPAVAMGEDDKWPEEVAEHLRLAENMCLAARELPVSDATTELWAAVHELNLAQLEAGALVAISRMANIRAILRSLAGLSAMVRWENGSRETSGGRIRTLMSVEEAAYATWRAGLRDDSARKIGSVEEALCEAASVLGSIPFWALDQLGAKEAKATVQELNDCLDELKEAEEQVITLLTDEDCVPQYVKDQQERRRQQRLNTEKETEPPTPEEVEDKETVGAAEEAIEAAAAEPDGGKKERRTRKARGRGKQKDPSPKEANEEAFETERAHRAAEEETLTQEAQTIWNGGKPNQTELDSFLKRGKHCQNAMAKVLESDKAEGLCPSLQSLSVA